MDSYDTEIEKKLRKLLLPGMEDEKDARRARKELALALHEFADALEVAGSDDFDASERKGGRNRDIGEIDSNNYNVRNVALELSYFGWGYRGFASQKHVQDTIEGNLFLALKRSRLIDSNANVEGLGYGRCGRTDKGVSALGQVVNLRLRSKARKGNPVLSKMQEIDYVKVLNKVLPDQIRVLGWTDVSEDFHARFHAKNRRYKYYFVDKGDLDLERMQAAAQCFVGEHDFRNFCRMDAINVHSYCRRICSFTIRRSSPVYQSPGEHPLYYMDIVGSSFLWHQVRCMAAVLFMVGRQEEEIGIVEQLLDLDQFSRKPQYKMAPDLPLLLHSCNFDDLRFERSDSARKSLLLHVEDLIEIETTKLEMMRSLRNKIACYGDETKGKIRCGHIPLRNRPTEKSYHERRERIEDRNQRSLP